MIRSEQWSGWGPLQFIGGDVTSATLGIVGAGRSAQLGAESKGFQMKVLYNDAIRNEVLEQHLQLKKLILTHYWSNPIM